ncbi:MAG TPA: hypothetical protein VKB73_04355 [Gaiellaceae bacterium]|nr:hypothetical protein [Gaiellaceae bacterium]
MKKLTLTALVLLALLLPGAARANGDPASDVLLTEQVFLPFEAPISKSSQDDLRRTVAEANKKGVKLRVAVIAFTSDLGTAVSLWKQPQDYSEFLGKEIAFVYTGPLLVAMPSGFGYYNQGKPVAKERRVLAKIMPGTIPTALADSTTQAVRALAASKGVTLKKPSSGSSATHDRLILGAAVLAFLVVLLLPARLVRRRGRGRGGEQSPSAGPR